MIAYLLGAAFSVSYLAGTRVILYTRDHAPVNHRTIAANQVRTKRCAVNQDRLSEPPYHRLIDTQGHFWGHIWGHRLDRQTTRIRP